MVYQKTLQLAIVILYQHITGIDHIIFTASHKTAFFEEMSIISFPLVNQGIEVVPHLSVGHARK